MWRPAPSCPAVPRAPGARSAGRPRFRAWPPPAAGQGAQGPWARSERRRRKGHQVTTLGRHCARTGRLPIWPQRMTWPPPQILHRAALRNDAARGWRCKLLGNGWADILRGQIGPQHLDRPGTNWPATARTGRSRDSAGVWRRTAPSWSSPRRPAPLSRCGASGLGWPSTGCRCAVSRKFGRATSAPRWRWCPLRTGRTAAGPG